MRTGSFCGDAVTRLSGSDVMNIATDQLIEVGVVVGIHGLRGDLKIQTLPTGQLALPGARQVYLREGADPPGLFRVVRVAPHKRHVLLRLAECSHGDAARALVGFSVWMNSVDVPEPAPGQHYWHAMYGLCVVDRHLGQIGRVVGMFSTAAHDILEVNGPHGEVLIPAIPQFIKQVDAEAGQLLVDLPQGLVDVGDDRNPQ